MTAAGFHHRPSITDNDNPMVETRRSVRMDTSVAAACSRNQAWIPANCICLIVS